MNQTTRSTTLIYCKLLSVLIEQPLHVFITIKKEYPIHSKEIDLGNPQKFPTVPQFLAKCISNIRGEHRKGLFTLTLSWTLVSVSSKGTYTVHGCQAK